MKIDNPRFTGEVRLLGDATTDLSGSFSGSFQGDGSGLTGVLTASYAENASGQVIETPTVSQSFSDTTSVTISHGFDTRNVLVSVYDDTFTQFIPDSITLTDTNTVDVNFISERSGIVVVAKGGHIVSGSTDNAVNLNGQPSSFYLDYDNFTNLPESGTTLDVGTTAEREVNPSIGRLRYNTSTQNLEMYDGNIWVAFQNNSYINISRPNLRVATFNAAITQNRLVDSINIDSSVYNAFAYNYINIEYLVVAGGGGGGNNRAGGGGAGGVRSSVAGDSSGGGSQAESPILTSLNTEHVVTVGAAGAAGYGLGNGGNGSNSTFNIITSVGGGGGGQYTTNANDGGSGGGAGSGDNKYSAPGSGTVNQGFAGGDGASTSLGNSGGGGGAGAVGQTAPSNSISGDGGIGVITTIINESIANSISVGEVLSPNVYFGGGGGGGLDERGSQNAGSGGTGGGGRGSNKGRTGGNPPAEPGSSNTGGGGGGGALNPNAVDMGGKAGGSGAVILRYPSNFTINVGAGLTASTTIIGSNKVTTFTEGTDTISFS